MEIVPPEIESVDTTLVYGYIVYGIVNNVARLRVQPFEGSEYTAPIEDLWGVPLDQFDPEDQDRVLDGSMGLIHAMNIQFSDGHTEERVMYSPHPIRELQPYEPNEEIEAFVDSLLGKMGHPEKRPPILE